MKKNISLLKKYINKNSILKSKDIKIGKGTRINGKILIHGKGKIVIKNFCAFGYGIKIISSNHKTNYANIQLMLQRKLKCIELETKNDNVEIGNNVWIGNNVNILSGVKIADGAVIGAGAVVNKDIKPFSIVAGVPAKHKKYRFNRAVKDFLLKINWWDWDEAKIKKNKFLFDIDFKKIKNKELIEIQSKIK